MNHQKHNPLKVKITFSDERYKIFRKEINVSLHREESIDAVHICNARLLLLLFPLASKCYLWKLLYTSVIFLSSCIFWKRYYLFTMSGLDCRKGNSCIIDIDSAKMRALVGFSIFGKPTSVCLSNIHLFSFLFDMGPPQKLLKF